MGWRGGGYPVSSYGALEKHYDIHVLIINYRPSEIVGRYSMRDAGRGE
jgi:hypothetical protein